MSHNNNETIYNFMILEFKLKFEDSLLDDGDDNGVGG
jgi:hypothetical protein